MTPILKDQSAISTSREKIIAGIGSPLGFFVLALLIVEGFLLGAGRFFDLPVGTRSAMVWVAVALFVLVVGVVVFLVVKYPKNLVFSEKSHLAFAHLQTYGDNSKPVGRDGLDSMQAVIAPPPINNQPLKLGQREDDGE